MKLTKKIPLLFSLVFLTFSSCNKQKAEALKIAVENFRSETITTLDKMNQLFNANMSVAQLNDEEEIQKIVSDLKGLDTGNAINADMLDQWSSEALIGSSAQKDLLNEFQKIKSQYYQFEGMFTSLENGSFFSKEAVKKAEKHSINLTLQLINYAKLVDAIDFKFASERVRLIIAMKRAKEEKNEALQNELINSLAIEFVKLRKNEEKQKADVIKLLLNTVQKGKLVSELIRNYEKMKVKDILNSIKNTLNYVNNVSGENATIKDYILKINTVESSITADPYWNTFLN